MAETLPQGLANHTRYDPLFHFFLLPVSAIMFLAAVWNAVRHPDFAAIWAVVGSVLLFLTVLKARIYSLKVQDRLIRLEERLRLAAVWPEPQRGQLGELLAGLTEKQWIALRFASDGELPALAARAHKEHLAPADIKKSIREWRGDHFRV
jgi:hypothetical protein